MKIIETRYWTASDVHAKCIVEDLYTMGDCDDYDNLLNTVRRMRHPTLEDIYRVAEDINRHSEGQTVTNIMYMLANDVIKSCFEIEE